MKRLLFYVVGCMGIAIFLASPVCAKVTGPCANCHTMHNSQNGNPVFSGGPNKTLLVNDCVGCHSSSTSSTYYDLGSCKVPVVLSTSGEPNSYLAGGNFWWVKEGLGGDDTKGHNVFLGEDDDNLARGPGGFPTGCTNSCHDNLSQPYTGENIYGNINGKYGCEGCHRPKHHANDHPNGQSGLADSVESGWYRFLSETHAENRYGVKGYEDGLWEAGQPDIAPGTTEHNEYLGYTGGENGISGPGSLKGLCQGCHINFGPGGGALPTNQQDAHGSWIRHPSDMQIPDSGEYANAGGASHLYDPLTPVARPNVNNSSSGTINVGIDMVTCLSCHRPHGSPYPDMLRWDYIQQIAGGGGDNGKGCFFCHTTKDDS